MFFRSVFPLGEETFVVVKHKNMQKIRATTKPQRINVRINVSMAPQVF